MRWSIMFSLTRSVLIENFIKNISSKITTSRYKDFEFRAAAELLDLFNDCSA